MPAGTGRVAADMEVLQPEEVVAVPRLAIDEVHAPAAELAALRDDHTARLRILHVDLST